jgi:hypothetical protein
MKKFLTLSTSVLILAACTNPNWMGSGYRWHDYTPISSPEPTASWSETIREADIYRGKSEQSIISGVSADIVETLETHLSRTVPVYLSPKNDLKERGALLDHALRTSLREKGYTLSPTPSKSHMLSYDVVKTVQEDAAPETYDIEVYGMGEEEWQLLELRTQELPSVK